DRIVAGAHTGAARSGEQRARVDDDPAQGAERTRIEPRDEQQRDREHDPDDRDHIARKKAVLDPAGEASPPVPGRRHGRSGPPQAVWSTPRKTWSSSARPVPSATQVSGSSAIETGRPVASRSTSSMPDSSAPPPVSTMPWSTMSAASSGAVFSSA